MKRFVRMFALAVAPLIGACGLADLTGPDGETFDAFVQTLEMEAFQSMVLGSAAEVEVTLLPGELVAGELSVRPTGHSGEDRLQSRAIGIAPNGDSGVLTLLMGDLQVSYDADTRFWFGDDEVDRDFFVAQVSGNLDEGFDVPLVAERESPPTPQEPEDDLFLAEALAITGDGAPRLRLSIDEDNFQMASNPVEGEPDGWLNVLGISIQIRVTDGTTELESEEHDFEEVEEFEGVVSSVSLDAASLTLVDGTVISLVDRTQVVQEDHFLGTLTAVAEALEAGQEVVSWGKGAVESEDPLVLLALKIAFKVSMEDEEPVEDFEGFVNEVRLDAGAFVVSDGTVVRIVERTEVVAYHDGGPTTLEGVAEALEDGYEVLAWGHGEVESEDPLTLEATRVVFKVREPHHGNREFGGNVVSVDLEAHSVVYDNGKTVRLTESTEIEAYNDFSPMSLEELAEAVEYGYEIRSWGHGEIESEEPLVFVAHEIVFKAIVEDFEQDVVSIDETAGTVTLENGWVLTVCDFTEIEAANDGSPITLEGANDALEAGDRVRMWGIGYVTGEEPVSLSLISLTINRIPAG